jgi:hypothetical protein
MQLVDAIQEITMQDPNPTWLSEEYQSILRDQEAVRYFFLSFFYHNRDCLLTQKCIQESGSFIGLSIRHYHRFVCRLESYPRS